MVKSFWFNYRPQLSWLFEWSEISEDSFVGLILYRWPNISIIALINFYSFFIDLIALKMSMNDTRFIPLINWNWVDLMKLIFIQFLCSCLNCISDVPLCIVFIYFHVVNQDIFVQLSQLYVVVAYQQLHLSHYQILWLSSYCFNGLEFKNSIHNCPTTIELKK